MVIFLHATVSGPVFLKLSDRRVLVSGVIGAKLMIECNSCSLRHLIAPTARHDVLHRVLRHLVVASTVTNVTHHGPPG
jgi:hypothetical protein